MFNIFNPFDPLAYRLGNFTFSAGLKGLQSYQKFSYEREQTLYQLLFHCFITFPLLLKLVFAEFMINKQITPISSEPLYHPDYRFIRPIQIPKETALSNSAFDEVFECRDLIKDSHEDSSASCAASMHLHSLHIYQLKIKTFHFGYNC